MFIKSKTLTIYPFFSSSFPSSLAISPFGSKTINEVLHCITFGLAKNLVLPAPDPPITSVFRFLRCNLPLKPIEIF